MAIGKNGQNAREGVVWEKGRSRLFFMQAFLQNNLVFLLIILWTLPWKGVALWKSARLSQKWWFVALLVINTIGILEILYIFVFSKHAGSGGTSETSLKN